MELNEILEHRNIRLSKSVLSPFKAGLKKRELKIFEKPDEAREIGYLMAKAASKKLKLRLVL